MEHRKFELWIELRQHFPNEWNSCLPERMKSLDVSQQTYSRWPMYHKLIPFPPGHEFCRLDILSWGVLQVLV
jgi:hypothetical protein